jgi:DNA-binding MarR family transcriptional regulator
MTTENQIKGVIGQIARIREQVNLIIEKELRNADISGVLPAHGSILYFLFKQSAPVAMKEVVEQVGRVKSTVTGMINTLEQHGYVEKFQSLEDGRVMLVQLTEKGRTIRPDFEKISKKLQKKVVGDMPSDDRETLVRLLMQVAANLEK